jgi:LemA protein
MWPFLGILFIILVIMAGIYNKLVRLRNQTKNGFKQIDVQLQRRADLIPNLVETVKAYMKHERQTLEAVIKARTVLQKAESIEEKAQANGQLTSALKNLFAVVESYPQLQANQNFLRLQEEITTTENQVAFARQYYNDTVMRMNTAVETFPQSLIANLFNFQQFHYFQVKDRTAKEAPKVQF